MKKEKCPYCGNYVTIKCERSMSGHLSVCRAWRIEKSNILNSITKDYLQKEHVEESKSLSEISMNLGLKHTRDLLLKLKEFNIPLLKYNTNESHKKRRIELAKNASEKKYGYKSHLMKGCSVRKKIKKTVKRRYGVENIFQVETIKEAAKKTNLKNYGVENASSSPVIRQKVIQTCINKYGVDNVSKIPSIIEKIQSTKFNNAKYTPYSKQSQKVFNFIFNCLHETELVDHIYYATLNKEFGKKINNRYMFYDFVISSIEFCIEYNGDYWHANPRKYSENDFTRKIWQRDTEKISALTNMGFEVWVIWESDFVNATDFYLSQILGRIYELRCKSKKIGLFESNIQRDMRKWESNYTNKQCRIL